MSKSRTYTLEDLANKLEDTFVKDEQIPLDKRQFGKIIIEEMRGQIGELNDNLSAMQQHFRH